MKVWDKADVLDVVKNEIIADIIGKPRELIEDLAPEMVLRGIAEDASGEMYVLNHYPEDGENVYSIWRTHTLSDQNVGDSELGELETLEMLPKEVIEDILKTFE